MSPLSEVHVALLCMPLDVLVTGRGKRPCAEENEGCRWRSGVIAPREALMAVSTWSGKGSAVAERIVGTIGC